MCQRSTEERGAPRLRGYGDGAYRQAPEAGKRGGIPIPSRPWEGGANLELQTGAPGMAGRDTR